mmetsp:Transcript_9932/g.36325  ORF Transcript_9932/g.36325 Transcript_9932/m.36325 type:complete len:366 (-) Transcript_9932:2395-3492(-)
MCAPMASASTGRGSCRASRCLDTLRCIQSLPRCRSSSVASVLRLTTISSIAFKYWSIVTIGPLGVGCVCLGGRPALPLGRWLAARMLATASRLCMYEASESGWRAPRGNGCVVGISTGGLLAATGRLEAKLAAPRRTIRRMARMLRKRCASPPPSPLPTSPPLSGTARVNLTPCAVTCCTTAPLTRPLPSTSSSSLQPRILGPRSDSCRSWWLSGRRWRRPCSTNCRRAYSGTLRAGRHTLGVFTSTGPGGAADTSAPVALTPAAAGGMVLIMLVLAMDGSCSDSGRRAGSGVTTRRVCTRYSSSPEGSWRLSLMTSGSSVGARTASHKMASSSVRTRMASSARDAQESTRCRQCARMLRLTERW